MVKRKRNLDMEEKMVEAIKIIDRDNEGRVSETKLRLVTGQSGENLTEKRCVGSLPAGDQVVKGS